MGRKIKYIEFNIAKKNLERLQILKEPLVSVLFCDKLENETNENYEFSEIIPYTPKQASSVENILNSENITNDNIDDVIEKYTIVLANLLELKEDNNKEIYNKFLQQ